MTASTTSQTAAGRTEEDVTVQGAQDDYILGIESQLTGDEKDVRSRVRSFVRESLKPSIEDSFESASFSRELIPELAELGLFGMHLEGYGCAGKGAVAYGLACMELEAGDSGVRTLVSVQGSLAMSAIHKFGTEEQKQEWLPPMARGEKLGSFGLTEPGAGSDPGSMTTTARRSADGGWIIDGAKRWIGLATVADVVVVWARDEESGKVRGFLVPTNSPGFEATEIRQKHSMRASIQCDIELNGVEVGEEALLPGVEGLKGPFACLNEARYGIVWGVLGAARDCYETALNYSTQREQFGKPVAGFQLTQQKLVEMKLEIEKGLLLALHIGREKEAGRATPQQISFGKLNNVREALDVAREARTILGGNGVTGEYPVMRHMANLESVLTYEGTSEVHTLVLGQAITGIQAFR
ncbi:acyl-CoA dehydrogenase family protein [Rubrobacter aplysinae]|uniref:acyl-CoA dehydrogenase family protein n=1 Tax=Rubrobacter aplysinae TaxID=909625 RepID=UPI000A0706AB|nr:acyl-CoA dehydrogenase family protein [Rubrobacter aplysinae]